MSLVSKTNATAIIVCLLGAGMPSMALAQTAYSHLPGITLTSPSTLPTGPFPAAGNQDCQSPYDEPKTTAGLHVQERGWGVISEAALGKYQLVSFAGEFRMDAYGFCALETSHIAVFDGTALKAIFQTADGEDQMIGILDERPNGSVRIWSGDVVSLPLGDINIADQTVVVGPVASEETFCNSVTVPNIYNISIADARETLSAAGWQAVPQLREEFSQQGDLHDLGISEAESCSGTGIGFCRYIYSASSASLEVTTVGEIYQGELPAVVDYTVTCAN